MVISGEGSLFWVALLKKMNNGNGSFGEDGNGGGGGMGSVFAQLLCVLVLVSFQLFPFSLALFFGCFSFFSLGL